MKKHVKKRLIRNAKDVRNELVIRAVVNCLGHFWIEVHKIVKRPYVKKTVYGTKYLMIDIQTLNGFDYNDGVRHLNDQIGNKSLGTTRLLRYSSRICNDLRAIDTVFDFMSYLGQDTSEQHREDLKAKWGDLMEEQIQRLEEQPKGRENYVRAYSKYGKNWG
jgi:hypothetical protein